MSVGEAHANDPVHLRAAGEIGFVHLSERDGGREAPHGQHVDGQDACGDVMTSAFIARSKSNGGKAAAALGEVSMGEV